MTDRELLELAAKAAGYTHYEYVENDYRDGRKVTGHYDSLLEVCINPLTDDGDALRLAVKLMFDIEVLAYATQINYIVNGDVRHCNVGSNEGAYSNNDPYAATRRAIVRAAAEIGKGMK